MSQGDSQESEPVIRNNSDETGSEDVKISEKPTLNENTIDNIPVFSDMTTPKGSKRDKISISASSEEIVEILRRLKEDVGQISELSAEEENIVAAFAQAFLKIMEPLTKALPVDVSVLPQELGLVEKANVIPKVELVLLFADGRMESIDLTERKNRDLLIIVLIDAMPRFNNLISKRRSKIEERIAFLSSVTKELQTIADSFERIG